MAVHAGLIIQPHSAASSTCKCPEGGLQGPSTGVSLWGQWSLQKQRTVVADGRYSIVTANTVAKERRRKGTEIKLIIFAKFVVK